MSEKILLTTNNYTLNVYKNYSLAEILLLHLLQLHTLVIIKKYLKYYFFVIYSRHNCITTFRQNYE